MPIVFSAVACERDIIANFASCDGNFMEIAEQVVSKLPPCNNKMTYSHGIYLLHYIAEDGYLYFCITDKLCQRSRAFLFLNEIQRRYITSKLNDDFTTVLAGEMYRYSEDYNTITIRKGELDELNKIGVGCSESLLGEKILYINNPDVISYSTVSQVTAIPERISVSVLSRPTEDMVTRAETISVSVINPVENITTEETTVIGKIENVVSSEDRIPVVKPTEEKIPTVSSENIYDKDTTPMVLPVVKPVEEKLPTVSSETIDDKDTTPMMSPILYIVIIGMIMLVVVMAIYAFGPISCAIVTSIGIYSLLRSYADSKGKSE